VVNKWFSFAEEVTVLLHITNQCNLKCMHCFVNAGSEGKDSFSYDKIMEIAKDLKELKVNLVAFSGGEPTLRPDFLKILEETNKIGLRACLVSNGTCVTEKLASGLKGLVRDVLISIDGPKEYHDFFRGLIGTYDRAMNGVKALKENNIPFSLQFTVSKKSWKYIDWMAELASQLGAQTLKLEPLFTVGRAEQLGDEYALDDAHLQSLNEKAIKLHGKYLASTDIAMGAYGTKHIIEHPCNVYACNGEDCHRRATKEPRELIIMPDGLVLPIMITMNKSYALGNVNDGRLLDIVRDYIGSPQHERFIKLCKHVFEKYVRGYPFPIIPWANIVGEESNKIHSIDD